MPASTFILFFQRLLVEGLTFCNTSSSLHEFCLRPRVSAPSLLSSEGITLIFSCENSIAYVGHSDTRKG